MGRCSAPRRPRRTKGLTWRGNELTAAPVGNALHALGPGDHLEVENPLILCNKAAGLLQQNPQLRAGVGRADCRQSRALSTAFTRHLQRHRTRGSAHLPHAATHRAL